MVTMYIYLDESGDLGFDFSKSKTTKKFVITLLVCDDSAANTQFEKAIRRTLKNKLNRKKGKGRYVHELKGNSTELKIKKYFYQQLKSSGWSIYSLILNKTNVPLALQTRDGKPRLYNHLSRELLEKLPLKNVYSNVRLVVDRSKNIGGVWDFNEQVKNHIEAILPLNTAFTVEHRRSEDFAGLQATDLFCWGIFRKHEYGDNKWYDVFAEKIQCEEEY